MGSHLAERLVAEGHSVIGLDCFDPYYSQALKENTAAAIIARGVDLRRLNLAHDALESVVGQVEVIFHLAAQPGNSAQTPFEHYLRNNIVATQRLLAAALQSSNLERFINVSTSSVYGLYASSSEETAPAPVSPYGVTKLAAEQLVLSKYRDTSFPACSLRLFSVYGERERPDKLYPKLIRAIANDLEFPLYDGSLEHTRSFSYIADIIDGFMAVLSNWHQAQGQIFNIGIDTAISTGEAIAVVEDIMGKVAKKQILPRRPGDQLATQADISKARRVLGYNPETKPQEGLERVVRWYYDQIHGKVDC